MLCSLSLPTTTARPPPFTNRSPQPHGISQRQLCTSSSLRFRHVSGGLSAPRALRAREPGPSQLYLHICDVKLLANDHRRAHAAAAANACAAVLVFSARARARPVNSLLCGVACRVEWSFAAASVAGKFHAFADDKCGAHLQPTGARAQCTRAFAEPHRFGSGDQSAHTHTKEPESHAEERRPEEVRVELRACWLV